MMPYRFFAAFMTSTAILAVSAFATQQRRGDSEPNSFELRTLDPEVVSVRLLLGVGDVDVRSWDGRVRLDKGEIRGIEGYRFRKGDRIEGRDSWKAVSRLIRKGIPKKAAVPKKQIAPSTNTFGAAVVPNGVIVSLKAPGEAILTVETPRGEIQIALSDLADGSPKRYLDGKVEAQIVATAAPLIDTDEQEDFPAAIGDREGGVWIAYVVHSPFGPEVLESFNERPKSFASSVPKGGGDQIKLMRFASGKAGEAIDVTGTGEDVWRPSVVLDGKGRVVVVWSENRSGNWDLYARRYSPAAKSWSDPIRLTDNPGADVDVVAATAPDGEVWIAWQAWIDGKADVKLAPLDRVNEAVRIGDPAANEWAPAIAIDRSGCVHIAYDTYKNANYDIMLSTRAVDGKLGEPIAIAATPLYETRPSVAADSRGRVWVAYEERTANWGKDAENLVEGKGSTLYRAAAVRVRCVDGARVLAAPDPVSKADEHLKSMNSFPRITCDRSGRVWLAFRHRQEAIWGNNAVMVVGGVWVEYASSLAGRSWTIPLPLPRSDGLLDNRPALVVPGDGPVLAVYSTDRRLRREVEFTPELSRRYWAQAGTPGTPEGAFNLDIQIAALRSSDTAAAVEPAASAIEPRVQAEAENPVHPHEADDVARMRSYRIAAGGKSYRFLRGDFHRHSEISQDGGSDGALEDMWRYAIDAAQFDWMGNEDHDNGGGKEYTWWLVQKTTDIYNGPSLVTMFTYERSNPYPHGHRNVMFARRGVRTLPRLVDAKGVVDDDTKMLYDYLKELGGVCASHTSGTGMGTDWRDVDDRVETFVEIYQGHRNSYEHLGAPRVARRPGEAIGGCRPLGMVWNALAMQYRFGFQASSDHISTHISYAIAVAAESSREGVLEAFKNRHCYAATDNIVLDVRSGEHIMGDEFDADGPVRLKIFAHGTRPIAKIDIIKDFVYVYSAEPNKERVSFEWTDDEVRGPGLSWYYVRVRQDDGQLAWASPIWVHSRRAAPRD